MSGARLIADRLRGVFTATVVACGMMVGFAIGARHPAIAAGPPASAFRPEARSSTDPRPSPDPRPVWVPRPPPVSRTEFEAIVQLDPGLQSPSGRDSLRRFQYALREPAPTRDTVAAALSRIVSAAGKDAAWKMSVKALSAVGSFEQMSYDPVAPGAHLLVKHPVADHLVPVVDFLVKGRMAELLGKQISPDAVRLMPFVYSTSGEEKLRRAVPLSRRVQGAGAERLLEGRFDEVDPTMFAGVEGQTVIVLGHIVGVGAQQPFEVRGPNGKRYIRVSDIAEAARVNRFNWFPLGCETDEASAIGTVMKINDNEAIDAFTRAVAGAGDTLRKLLMDLSAPEIEIAIDLAHLDGTDIIPIELRDVDGRIYRSGPMPTVEQATPPMKG